MSFTDKLLIALDCVMIAGLVVCIVGGALLGTWYEVTEGSGQNESAKR